MDERKTIRTIREVVMSGKLKEPFNPRGVHAACPSIPLSTCRTFLPKHRVGNPGNNTELSIRVGKGLYKLK